MAGHRLSLMLVHTSPVKQLGLGGGADLWGFQYAGTNPRLGEEATYLKGNRNCQKSKSTTLHGERHPRMERGGDGRGWGRQAKPYRLRDQLAYCYIVMGY